MFPNNHSSPYFPRGGKRSSNDLNPLYGLNKRGKYAMGDIQNKPENPYLEEPNHQVYANQQFPLSPRVFQNVSYSRQREPKMLSGQTQNFGHTQYLPNATLYDTLNIPRPRTIIPSATVSRATPVKMPHFPPQRRLTPHLLTGTVGKVLLWTKMARNRPVLFEVIGNLDYVRQGNLPSEKLFMMRDPDSGAILQVVFYEIDRPLLELEPGSLVKVTGQMSSRSRLQAYNVIKISPEELAASQHIVFICDRAAQDLINAHSLM